MADEWIDHARNERFRSQLDEALTRLTEDRHDVVARAALGEAIDALVTADRLTHEEAEGLRDAHLASPPVPFPLTTDRLTIRPVVAGDAAAQAVWLADEETCRFLLYPPMSREQVDALVARKSAVTHPTRAGQGLDLVAEHDGQVIGDFMLHFVDSAMVTAEVGWVFSPSVAGRGFATEAMKATLELAFGHFHVHRVIATLDARNTASAALCERLGMRRESVKLSDYWSRGEFTSSYDYALLASEHAGRLTS